MQVATFIHGCHKSSMTIVLRTHRDVVMSAVHLTASSCKQHQTAAAAGNSPLDFLTRCVDTLPTSILGNHPAYINEHGSHTVLCQM